MQITLVVGDREPETPPDGYTRTPVSAGRVVTQLGGFTACHTTPGGRHEGAVARSEAGLALVVGDPVYSGTVPLEARLHSLLGSITTLPDNASIATAVGHLVGEFRGAFAAVLIPNNGRRAVIAGDALGVRPVYRRRQANRCSFSTSLALIADTLARRPDPDLVGVLQWSGLDTIWGNRTILEGVSRNRAAEIAIIESDGRLSTHSYLDWTSLATVEEQSLDSAAAAVLEMFREAVRLRAGRDESAVAFLSGGMDSRLLVNTLREVNLQVQTFGFAPRDTQDLLFAAEYARAAGVSHRSVPRVPSKRTDWGALMQAAVAASVAEGWLVTRPEAVWSGDGGSVGMGGVNVGEALVSAFAARDDHQVAHVLLRDKGFGLPRLTASPARRRAVFEAVYADALAEIRPLRDLDPGRAARTLLMLNDQRRHLDWYHERLPHHGIHYILPFYDRRLLALLGALPFDLLDRHQLYTRVFELVGPPITAAPYQTYPGHLPSLVEARSTLQYQWQPPGAAWRSAADRGPLIATGVRAILSRRLGRFGLRRSRIALAAALHALGARDQTAALALISDLQIASGIADGTRQ